MIAWKDTITTPDAGEVLQQGTPIAEIPEDLLKYVAGKYPHEILSAELLEKAEKERRSEGPCLK